MQEKRMHDFPPKPVFIDYKQITKPHATWHEIGYADGTNPSPSMNNSSSIRFRAAPAFVRTAIRYIRVRRKARAFACARDARTQEQTSLWLMSLRARIAEAELKQTSQVSIWQA